MAAKGQRVLAFKPIEDPQRLAVSRRIPRSPGGADNQERLEKRVVDRSLQHVPLPQSCRFIHIHLTPVSTGFLESNHRRAFHRELLAVDLHGGSKLRLAQNQASEVLRTDGVRYPVPGALRVDLSA